MAETIDRLRLLRPLGRAAVRRLEGNGAAVSGSIVICPAGTTVERVQGMVVLRFWEADEQVIVFPEGDVEVMAYPRR